MYFISKTEFMKINKSTNHVDIKLLNYYRILIKFFVPLAKSFLWHDNNKTINIFLLSTFLFTAKRTSCMMKTTQTVTSNS